MHLFKLSSNESPQISKLLFLDTYIYDQEKIVEANSNGTFAQGQAEHLNRNLHFYLFAKFVRYSVLVAFIYLIYVVVTLFIEDGSLPRESLYILTVFILFGYWRLFHTAKNYRNDITNARIISGIGKLEPTTAGNFAHIGNIRLRANNFNGGGFNLPYGDYTFFYLPTSKAVISAVPTKDTQANWANDYSSLLQGLYGFSIHDFKENSAGRITEDQVARLVRQETQANVVYAGLFVFFLSGLLICAFSPNIPSYLILPLLAVELILVVAIVYYFKKALLRRCTNATIKTYRGNLAVLISVNTKFRTHYLKLADDTDETLLDCEYLPKNTYKVLPNISHVVHYLPKEGRIVSILPTEYADKL